MSMKFLIVSDTHGRMYNLEEAMEREETKTTAKP